MRFGEILNIERYYMQQLKRRYESDAEILPEIKFYVRHDGGRKRYYITTSEQSKEKYIGWRNNSELLQSLLMRENARDKLRKVTENIEILDGVMKQYHLEKELLPSDDCTKITKRGLRHLPKSQNPFRRHELIHDTGLGFFTRSKSEAIIARRLYAHGFMFQYERKLRIKSLDGRWKSIYPDFTIWLFDGTVVYWEHEGKIPDEDYRMKFIQRLAEYHAADLLVSRNVFVTMDGPKGDIDIETIDNLIRSF